MRCKPPVVTRRITAWALFAGILVTDDHAGDWGPCAHRRALSHAALHRRFFEESGEVVAGRQGEQVPQTWIAGDVDHCVEELIHFVRTFGITRISMAHGSPAGKCAPATWVSRWSGCLPRVYRE